jgi:hypothetical protein
LAAKEDLETVDGGSVKTALVCGGGEAEGKENPVDVGFPKVAGFGVSLKGVLYREDKGAVQVDTMASGIPCGVVGIDVDIRRSLGAGGIGICIGGIEEPNEHAVGGCKTSESAEAGLGNTRSECAFCVLELGSGAFGSVAALSSFAAAVLFDDVRPM